MNFGPFTIALVLITALISIPAMNDDRLINKLILWPRKMNTPGEYYRLLTAGFIHADWGHLLFNMFALLTFGSNVERQFSNPWIYIFLYLSGIIAASLPSFVKNRDNAYYRALGASGGTAAIIFSSVYFAPWSALRFAFIPVNIPSIVFAIGYLIYSGWASKNKQDNVGHDAHFWGSIYGFAFTLLIEPTHGLSFIQQLMHPQFSLR